MATNQQINPAVMRRAMVKQTLDLRGVTISSIARRLGVSQGQVSNVLAGRRRNAGVEKTLAGMVGMTAVEMFGPAPRKKKARS